jgi:alpha-L-fucosidase
LSLDRGTLYLYVYDRPYENVLLKGVKNKIKSVSVVGDGRQVKCQAIGGFQEVPPVQWITVPEDCLDPYVTVLKVELDSPLDLYLGDIKGQDLYKEETK